MKTKIMVKKVGGKDIVVNLYQCDKTLKITGFSLTYKGVDCSPSDLKLSDRDYVFLMYNAYSQLNCSFLNVILDNYQRCSFYVKAYNHSHRDLEILNNRLKCIIDLIDVVTVYKGVTLYGDCDGTQFILENGVKKLFKNELSFNRYVTKQKEGLK